VAVPTPLADAWSVLLVGARTGDARSLGKLCTLIEGGGPDAQALLTHLDPETGHARRIGFTGPPGSGKSSLLHHALTTYRARINERTALVAVDPTSPRTGGALLGDRIRWSVHQTADNLFLRSMASRGSLGGLAAGTRDLATLLDACGFDRVLIETVGVGQIGTAIAETVDCLVVVLNPESGDAVQMLKAGLLELADIYVINKADRPGAQALRDHLEGALEIATVAGRTQTPPQILLASAAGGTGLEELWSAIDEWFVEGESSGRLAERRREQRKKLVYQLVEEAELAALHGRLADLAIAADRWEALDARTVSPASLAKDVQAELHRAAESQ